VVRVRLIAVAVLIACVARADEHALSPRAQQIASILGLEPLLERIAELAASPNPTMLEFLKLRQDALIELEEVSLMIEATQAGLQQEEFSTSSARSFVNDHYESAVSTWNISALIVGNGFTVVGSALQFDGNTQAYIGDGIIIGGAVIATALGVVGLVKKNKGRAPFVVETNYLATLLGRKPTERSELPDPVRRYLDETLAGEKTSIRAQLLEKWVKQGSVPAGHADEHRIDQLAQPIRRGTVISSDVLGDRADMLADLRARVAQLYAEVRMLMREVRAQR
jgi:hypothetical protein